MKHIFKLVVVMFCLISQGQAYFGLTGKSQLSDLWSINLNAASLASAKNLDTWNKESDELEPSREYTPVDMSLQPSRPFPVKRKRVASQKAETTKKRGHSRFDFPKRPSYNPGTTNEPTHSPYRHQDNSNYNQYHVPSGSDNKRTYPVYRNAKYKQTRQSHIRRATPNIRTRQSSRHTTKQPTDTTSYSQVRSDRKIKHKAEDGTTYNSDTRRPGFSQNSHTAKEEGSLRKPYGKTHETSQFEAKDDLSRDIAVLVNHSFSTPRIRSERESGKRRDLFGVRHNPKQYLIASSNTQSITPSRVGQRSDGELDQRPWMRTDRPGQRKYKNQSRSIIHVSSSRFGGVLEFDEEQLNSYSDFIESKVGNFTEMVAPQKIDKRAARKLCKTFRLNSGQRKKCKRDPGLPQVLAKATHIAAAECLYQFRYERWNCSLGTSRLHLLNKGNKETAFLYSISSAGLTHSVARACAQGHLEKCSCEESYDEHLNQETWLWGGCGDNVRYAAKFVRRFLRSQSDSSDIRAEIDRHNSDLGIRFVKSNVRQTCKCHGVSGSCTTKTCWRKMAPFYEIGRKIKRAYDKAVKVENISNSSGRPKLIRMKRRSRTSRRLSHSIRHRNKARKNSRKINQDSNGGSSHLTRNNHRTRATTDAPAEIQHDTENDIPKKKELVYIEKSPAYCKKSKYSLGTKGRICGKESDCKRMCCGRGYTTHVRIVRRSCECQVKWCCYVQCKTCNERKKIHTCK